MFLQFQDAAHALIDALFSEHAVLHGLDHRIEGLDEVLRTKHDVSTSLQGAHGSLGITVLLGDGSHVFHDAGDGRGDDDTACLLVVEGDSGTSTGRWWEGSRSPVVQSHVELLLLLTLGWNDLLIGQALVLVERQSLSEALGGIKPLVAVLLLGILLQVGRLYRLSLDCRCAAKEDGGKHP